MLHMWRVPAQCSWIFQQTLQKDPTQQLGWQRCELPAVLGMLFQKMGRHITIHECYRLCSYANAWKPFSKKQRNGSLENGGFPHWFSEKKSWRSPRSPENSVSPFTMNFRMWWSLPARLWWSDPGFEAGLGVFGSWFIRLGP